MDYAALFERWRTAPDLDDESRRELSEIENDACEIEDRFGSELSFGTGGMRGVLGVGINRMNRYTVHRATEGFARYLLDDVPRSAESGVVIAYDSRRGSREFATEAARVLAAHGIRVYVFDDIRPTPVLSYAVRELGAAGGIVITASHNPPEYNGYKVYGPDGVQVLPEAAEEIAARAAEYQDYLTAPGEAKVPIQVVGGDLDERYVSRVVKLVGEIADCAAKRDMRARLGVVYTPLHGTGYKLVPRVLGELGFSGAVSVPEQSVPSGDFPTVRYPNPEDPAAFNLAIEQACSPELAKRPDVIVATDPDCDRVGVAVWDGEKYRHLTGNQVGVLLCDLLIDTAAERGLDLGRCTIVKTIVTTEMVTALASAHGARVIDTLTGFKYIGALIGQIEKAGLVFLLGMEESCGYLTGSFVRDKDGVIAASLVCCAAARQLARGRTLIDRLGELYAKYGFYEETLCSVPIASTGPGGAAEVVEALRRDMPDSIGGYLVEEVRDYQTGWTKRRGTGVRVPLDFPKENCIQVILAGGPKLTLRPSGTEPKLKLYVAAAANGADEAKAKAHDVQTAMRRILPVADGCTI